jgi:hypothetical protein
MITGDAMGIGLVATRLGKVWDFFAFGKVTTCGARERF